MPVSILSIAEIV